MTSSDKERRERIEKEIGSRFEPGRHERWWPYVRSVSDEMANWDSLLPDLYREWKVGRGPITEYYVTGLIDIATKVIPIVDEVERTWRQAETHEHGV